jgi:hypothetical protein
MHGVLEEVGPAFLKNVTLWFGCPWTLPTYMDQLGGIGMIAVGVSLVTFIFPASGTDPNHTSNLAARLEHSSSEPVGFEGSELPIPQEQLGT